MNNRFIKDQWPNDPEKTFNSLYLSPKCKPFDDNPFSFNPKGHYSNLYDLLDCISAEGHEGELLSRFVQNSASNNGKLFIPVEEVSSFGNEDVLARIAFSYNESLYGGFRPNSEIGIYRKNVYNKGYELKTVEIIKKIFDLSKEGCELSECFDSDKIDALKELSLPEKLDDIEKETILTSLFLKSRVHLIYGAAGTGKTTLINHISNLLSERRRIFLAKTNPAVENLRRKVTTKTEYDEFITIDRFIRNPYYVNREYDLIVVDECSTVKNEEILRIISMLDSGALVLVGDIYQIEAIGFGNWFRLCKNLLPDHCIHELTTPHRSSDEDLKALWNEVRNMTDDNIVLEQTVRKDYSHPIDDDIFSQRSDDEIILCLNYNGLYGLNNINRLLQLSNPNKAIGVGICQFKVGDPILFNDSERFPLLYNNLKGKIVDIQDFYDSVYFVLEIELHITERDVLFCDGLDLIEEGIQWSKVGFKVDRREPYSSDEESSTSDHILPFQVAYAVSIHKSQGLEYDSVKIVIADETENRITHNIFYTAITRAKNHLRIYWSPEVCNKILNRIRPLDSNKDYYLLKEKNSL
jgi:energy-coupling factor transporter ATP-binding protein EcfA2